MKETMKLRSARMSPEAHAALAEAAKAQNLDMAEVLRDLLTKYVAGNLDVQSDAPAVTYRFYVQPSLMNAAEAKGEAQGYSFGVLSGKLVEHVLLQNK